MSHSPYYEKNHTVLWALTPEGIVLHNFANRQFTELKGLEHLVWAYLDGVHCLEDVRFKIMESYELQSMQADAIDQLIQKTFAHLQAGEFIVERVL